MKSRKSSVLVARAFGLALVLLAAVMGAAATARAQGEIAIQVEKHAVLVSDSSISFRVRVTCGPLPGAEDFREALAGAGQEKTEAGAEGGLSPDLVCDGIERGYTAGVSVITEALFKRGPAVAFVNVVACNVVGDEQVCIQESVQRRIIVSGRAPTA